jgi:hypothetical protein
VVVVLLGFGLGLPRAAIAAVGVRLTVLRTSR